MQPNTYLISIHSSSVKKYIYVLSIYSWLWKHNSLALQVFFVTCVILHLFDNHRNNFPFNSAAGQGTQKCLFPSVKCTQYHIVEVISPRMWFFSLHFSLRNTHNQKHTHAHTLYMRAYVLYLSLCWANTPLCLTCFLCHDDERHLLFSAETPLHPMLLTSCLHYSQVEWLLSHFSERLNFCDMGWSEMQDSRVGSMTSGNLFQSQEDCGGFYSHFVPTLWNVNIILPVHFQISLLLQTAGNNFFFFSFFCDL